MERYDIAVDYPNPWNRVYKREDGAWVKAEEALAIEAERDALQKEVEALKKHDVICNFAETPKYDEYGVFEAIMYHPKKGIQIGQGNRLIEAKRWASYMIYEYKCVPMYFLNKENGEIYPPIGIPKY